MMKTKLFSVPIDFVMVRWLSPFIVDTIDISHGDMNIYIQLLKDQSYIITIMGKHGNPVGTKQILLPSQIDSPLLRELITEFTDSPKSEIPGADLFTYPQPEE